MFSLSVFLQPDSQAVFGKYYDTIREAPLIGDNIWEIFVLIFTNDLVLMLMLMLTRVMMMMTMSGMWLQWASGRSHIDQSCQRRHYCTPNQCAEDDDGAGDSDGDGDGDDGDVDEVIRSWPVAETKYVVGMRCSRTKCPPTQVSCLHCTSGASGGGIKSHYMWKLPGSCLSSLFWGAVVSL